MNVSFLPSVTEGKEVGLRERCPCGHSRPWEAEWVFSKLTSISAWKYKKPSWEVFVNCLQICITNWNANNNCTVCVTSRISKSVLVPSSFYFWSSHKITPSPVAQQFFSSEIFQNFLFACPDYSFSLLFPVFVPYFPYLPAESRHPINIQCENHVSVCMLCTCCSKKNIKLCK